MSHDLVIRNGNVVDGLGNRPKQVDIAIDNDQIVNIGEASGKGKRDVLYIAAPVVSRVK